MLVTCRICKEKIDRDTAYKRVVNGKNLYYHSQEEYDKCEKEKEYKEKVYRLVCDIIERKEILNTVFWKEKAIWNKVCSDEIVAKYLEENKAYLHGSISRLEDKEFNRIRYLSAILKNNLGDFKPKEDGKRTFITIVDEHYETKFKSKVRCALEDLEEDCDE